MLSVYQQPKSRDIGVNLCEGCFSKQLKIDRLEEENQRLRAELSRKKRKDKEGFFGSSTPSSQIPNKANSPQEKVKKQGGAKQGHPGKGRKKHKEEEIDQIREVHVESNCPHCASELNYKDTQERSVLDIDPIVLRRVLYRLERKECPCCGSRVSAKTKDALPRSLLSNSLIAEILDSHYLQGIPLGRICSRWGLNYGTVIGSLHRVAGLFSCVMANLKEDYRNSFIRHADETRWRCDGENGYCWLFLSDSVSLHLYRKTRSASVVEEVFGRTKLSGYLTVDRYGSYNQVPCKLQYCFAHLLREILDLQKEFESEEEVELFSKAMSKLLSDVMHLQSSDVEDVEYYLEAKRIKSEILKICHSPSHHLAIKRWQDFFVEKAERLYNWVSDRRVPCENNRAERELRPTVIARKVSFGSQAEEGRKTREVLMCVMQTLKKRVSNPRERFKEVLEQITINPETDLYQTLFETNSS